MVASDGTEKEQPPIYSEAVLSILWSKTPVFKFNLLPTARSLLYRYRR